MSNFLEIFSNQDPLELEFLNHILSLIVGHFVSWATEKAVEKKAIFIIIFL